MAIYPGNPLNLFLFISSVSTQSPVHPDISFVTEGMFNNNYNYACESDACMSVDLYLLHACHTIIFRPITEIDRTFIEEGRDAGMLGNPFQITPIAGTLISIIIQYPFTITNNCDEWPSKSKNIIMIFHLNSDSKSLGQLNTICEHMLLSCTSHDYVDWVDRHVVMYSRHCQVTPRLLLMGFASIYIVLQHLLHSHVYSFTSAPIIINIM